MFYSYSSLRRSLLFLLFSFAWLHAKATITFSQDNCSIQASTTLPGQGGENPGGHFYSYQWSYTLTYSDGGRTYYGIAYTEIPKLIFPTSGRKITGIELDVRAAFYSGGYYQYSTAPLYYEYNSFSSVPNSNPISVTAVTSNYDSNDKAITTSLVLAPSSSHTLMYADRNGWIRIAQYYSNVWHNWYLTKTWDNYETLMQGGSVAALTNDQVVFTGTDRKVHVYYYASSNGWSHGLLTHVYSASEDVASGPDAISVGKSDNVFFAGKDGWMHLYSYNFNTSQWDHQILSNTRNTNEQVARSLGQAIGTVAASPYEDIVYYKGQDGLMQEYYKSGSGAWEHKWLEQLRDETVAGQIVVGKNERSVYFVAAYPNSSNYIKGYFISSPGIPRASVVKSLGPIPAQKYVTTPEGNLSIGVGDQLYFSGSYMPESNSSTANSRLQTAYRVNDSGYDGFLQTSGNWPHAFLDNDNPYAASSSLPTSAQIATGARIVPDNTGGVYYVGTDGFIRLYSRDACLTGSAGVLLRGGSATAMPGTVGPPPTVASNIITNHTLLVYPNPASKSATIAYVTEKDAMTSIEVINALGKVVYRVNNSVVQGQNNILLNTSSLSPGSYTVSINEVGKPTQKTKLLIIE